MYTAILATALTGFAVVDAATGQLGDAAIVQGNPVGVTYTATLPNSPTTGIRGYVAGTSNANGTGVNFNVNLFGFPDSSLGPFCKLVYPATHRTSEDIYGTNFNTNASVPHPRPASSCKW